MVIAAAAVVLFAATAVAQTRPPIPGVTGVVVPEGAGDGATDAIAAAAAKAAEGTQKVLRAVGIGKEDASKRDPMAALTVGAMVVLSFDADVDAGKEPSGSPTERTTEGKIIELDRRAGVILVRLADRTTERLRLAKGDERTVASGSTPKDAGPPIRVSYVDPNGDKTVVLFHRAW